jgi:hypothetical protein
MPSLLFFSYLRNRTGNIYGTVRWIEMGDGMLVALGINRNNQR